MVSRAVISNSQFFGGFCLRRLWSGCFAAVLLVLGSAPAHAITTLVDNFDAEPATLNMFAFNNWDVSNGSVDTIASGTFFINCAGGGGICIDLDGTTSNAGKLISKGVFPPGRYRLSFDLAGNQQGVGSGFGPDHVTVEFGLLTWKTVLQDSAKNSANFTTHTFDVSVPSPGSKLSFENTGGTDTGGPILDNVSVTPLAITTPVTPTEGVSSVNREQSADVGDPINSFTGELYFHEDSDLILQGGSMLMKFQRYYASQKRLGNSLPDSLGRNWAHNFDWTLNQWGTDASVRSPEGKVINFVNNAGWQTAKTYYHPYQLVQNTVTGEFSFHDMQGNMAYVFDALNGGRLKRIENGRGGVLTMAYNAAGLLSGVSDGLGRSFSLTYNVLNQMTGVSDGTRNISFSYDPVDGDLVTARDPLGLVTTYSYDQSVNLGGNGKLTVRTRAMGNAPFRQSYVTTPGALFGRVSSQTDAAGNRTTITYPPQGGAGNTVTTNALGKTSNHTYTAGGELTGVSNFSLAGTIASPTFTATLDAAKRRNSLTDRLGDITRYTYHAASGKIASITHADGSSTAFSYTLRLKGGLSFYDLTAVTHADASIEMFAYDASGNLASHTNQLGNIFGFTYNAMGKMLTASLPGAGTSTKTYNADGTLATASDPAGNTSLFGYDALKRPNRVTHPDASTTAVTYDGMDRLLTSTDENGNVTTLSYDANGNLLTRSDPLANITSFAYDGNDRLTGITTPLGGSSTTSYDVLGRVGTVTDANGNTTTLGYDSQGRVISVTDPLGKIWSRSFDLEGIPASASDPLGNATTFVSDKMGRITQISSPLGNAIGIAYDVMGRVTATTDPLGNMASLTRDAAGRISAATLPGGAIAMAYTRNALGQITRCTDPNGNNWLRAFDGSARQISSTDPLGQVRSNTFDNRNRLNVVAYPGGAGSLTMAYDGVGNLTSRIYSDGTTLNYAYDAANRLTTANGIAISYDADGRRTNTNGIGIAYDAGGRITGMTLAAGKTITYAYDANDRLISVTDWLGGVTGFSYDAAGRMTGMTRPNGINRSNTFDADSRLTAFAEGTLASSALTRDAKGQVTAATRNQPSVSSVAGIVSTVHTFDAASQVTGTTYDTLGRLTASGADTYAWDLASRLTAYQRGGVAVSAGYDGAGFRLSRTSSAVTHQYVWNFAMPLPSVSIEKQGATVLRYYVHTPGGTLLYSIDAATNARTFYHFDEMGNTLFISNDAGVAVASYAYSPFGELLSTTGVLANPFTWQGQFGVMDDGNGLYYIRARYYDAKTGRFISRDTLKGKGPKRVNPYQYALNNPAVFVDVDGRDPTDAANVKRLQKFGVLGKKKMCKLNKRPRLEFSFSLADDSPVSGIGSPVIKLSHSKREAVKKTSPDMPAQQISIMLGSLLVGKQVEIDSPKEKKIKALVVKLRAAEGELDKLKALEKQARLKVRQESGSSVPIVVQILFPQVNADRSDARFKLIEILTNRRAQQKTLEAIKGELSSLGVNVENPDIDSAADDIASIVVGC